jgi:hypothetical protein
MKDYWRSFDILKVINNIDPAWEEVSVNCLTGAWLQFRPQFVHLFAGFEPVEKKVGNFEVRHSCCINPIINLIVYYTRTYSRTQLYFN